MPQNGRIELSFDRLLLPLSILRQTFVLNQTVGNGATTLTPSVAYDPVARVVTVTPQPDQPFVMGQSYTLFISSPSSPSDQNGLRAIDGANLSPTSPSSLTFQITAPAAAPAEPPIVDFCRDIHPLFLSKCNGATCHGTPAPAEGLLLSTNQGVLSAIGRVANGSNMGPLAVEQPASLIFNEDMPIIDPGPNVIELDASLLNAAGGAEAAGEEGGEEAAAEEAGTGSGSDAGASDASSDGDPSDAGVSVDATTGTVDAAGVASDATVASADAAGVAASGAGFPGDAGAAAVAARPGDPAHSWIMYKLLMSVPPGTDSSLSSMSPSTAGVYSVACDDAGDLCPTALSDPERSRLANLIPGREMPYPASADAAQPNPFAMTLDELELMSFWIAEGAPVEETCP